MSFNELEKVFLARCEEYAKSINALGTKTTSEKKTTFFSISLSSIKIQFIYSKKRGAFDLPSTIFARIYLNKNTNHFYHIPELLAFLKIDDYRACYFPYIESEERMNCCFDALTEVLDSHISNFEKIVTTFRHEEMRRYQFESIKGMYSLKEEDYNEEDIYVMMLEMGETMSQVVHKLTPSQACVVKLPCIKWGNVRNESYTVTPYAMNRKVTWHTDPAENTGTVYWWWDNSDNSFSDLGTALTVKPAYSTPIKAPTVSSRGSDYLRINVGDTNTYDVKAVDIIGKCSS